MLEVRMWHGLEHAPLRFAAAAAGVDALPSERPYFGIIARGVLARAPQIAGAGADARAAWANAAPWLELVDSPGEPPAPPESVLPWLHAARDARALTVRESAEACKAFAIDWFELVPGHGELSLDVWLIKEGHTSSVWHVTATAPDGGMSGSAIAVNVARDREAALELAASYAHMSDWHATDPLHVAAPLALETIALNAASRSVEATVAAHAWIPGRELHVRRRLGSDPELLALDGFLGDDGRGGIRAVGRALSPADQKRVWSELRSFLQRHGHFDGESTVRLPSIEINDGDLVWTGDRLVVVAASA